MKTLSTTPNYRQLLGQLAATAFALILLLVFEAGPVNGQTQNVAFSRLKLADPNDMYTGIALSPDGKMLAICTRKNQPIRIFDVEAQEVIREIDSRSGIKGSKLYFSQNGNFLILQEQAWYEQIENKNRKINFKVLSLKDGSVVKSFDAVQDVLVSPDESTMLSLSGNEITFWSTANGNKIKSLQIAGIVNAMALSPNGKTLAVSQRINAADLKGFANFKKKKQRKFAARYKQQLAFFDAESGRKIKSVSQLYDLIYRLRYADDGSLLYVFSQPHIKAQTTQNQIAYINLVDMAEMKALRRGFSSQAIGLPDAHLSSDRQFFALNSKGNRFQEILLYDNISGSLIKRFELANRLFEKSGEGTRLHSDARPSFVFLPRNEGILVAMGNQLIVWNFNEDQ